MGGEWTVSHAKFYFEFLYNSYVKFEDAMEYHNFYKLFLYYDFMSFAPSCTESFVKRNNDITQSRYTIIFMIKQCSTHILPNEQEFTQVLILIVQASNSKLHI